MIPLTAAIAVLSQYSSVRLRPDLVETYFIAVYIGRPGEGKHGVSATNVVFCKSMCLLRLVLDDGNNRTPHDSHRVGSGKHHPNQCDADKEPACATGG